MKRTFLTFVFMVASAIAQSTGTQSLELLPVVMNSGLIRLMSGSGAGGAYAPKPYVELLIGANGTAYDGYQVAWQVTLTDGTTATFMQSVLVQSGGWTMAMLPNVDATSVSAVVVGYKLSPESRAAASVN